MEIIICQDADEVARVAAAKVARVVKDRGPKVVLGVATGSSPLGLYAQLAAMVAAGEIDLTHASAFALDEYVGLSLDHPESYHSVIDRTVTQPLRLSPLLVHVPDGMASDIDAAAAAYEAQIAAVGGIDIQILGVGGNGHVGFNEPTSSLASRTRIKTLTAQTRRDNARFFDNDLDAVPTHCMTQGLGTICDAHEVLLVAQGEGKADAVARVVEGPVSAMVPGSVLQLHRMATVIVDEEAAARLTLQDFYRETYGSKPAWQRFKEGL